MDYLYCVHWTLLTYFRCPVYRTREPKHTGNSQGIYKYGINVLRPLFVLPFLGFIKFSTVHLVWIFQDPSEELFTMCEWRGSQVRPTSKGEVD